MELFHQYFGFKRNLKTSKETLEKLETGLSGKPKKRYRSQDICRKVLTILSQSLELAETAEDAIKKLKQVQVWCKFTQDLFTKVRGLINEINKGFFSLKLKISVFCQKKL